MSSMLTTIARRITLSLPIALVCLLMGSAPAQAQVAKDTPLGIEFVPPHFPDSSIDESLATLAKTAEIGGHSSFIWHWGDRQALPAITSLVPVMKSFGLKSLIQMGTVFLGNPAPPEGFRPSFADPAVRALYLSDVATLAATHPSYMVLTTEVNILYRFNRTEFDNFRPLYQQAYNLVKSISPETKVGASFLESIWFANFFLDGVDVPAMLAPSDFIAFTDYPEWLVSEGHYASIADIPAEWDGATRLAYPNAHIIYSEVGWSSKGRGTPELQAEFMRNLPRLMSLAKPDLVTWSLMADVEFFNRDLLSPDDVTFLEGLGVDIDTLFEHFNGMGLMQGDGLPKPALLEASLLNFKVP